MAMLPLIPRDGPDHGRWHHSPRASLPVFYMNDFSRLGLRVHPCEEALRLLEKNRYQLVRDENGCRVILAKAAQLPRLIRLLDGHGVICEIADVADQVYQG